MHGSYNDSDEPAQLQVVLAPGGRRRRLRRGRRLRRRALGVAAMKAVLRPRGRRARVRGLRRPGRRARRGRRRAEGGGDQPARPARPQPARAGLRVPAAARPRLGRRRHPPRHRRGGRHLPGLALGRRARTRPGRTGRSSAAPSNGTYAELVKVPEENVFPKPARFSWEEAAAFPLAALTAYRALFAVGRLHGGRDRARARRGQRRLDVRRAARGAGGRARARHLVVAGEDRAREGARRRRRRALHGGGLGGGGRARSTSSSTPSARPGASRSRRCAAGGRLVVFGGTGGPEVTLDVRALYLNWKSILGTTMGSPLDFFAMMRHGQRRRLASGDRQRPPARRGRGRARPDEGRASTSASSCSRSSS